MVPIATAEAGWWHDNPHPPGRMATGGMRLVEKRGSHMPPSLAPFGQILDF